MTYGQTLKTRGAPRRGTGEVAFGVQYDAASALSVCATRVPPKSVAASNGTRSNFLTATILKPGVGDASIAL